MIQNWERGKKEVGIERQNPRGEKRVESIRKSEKKESGEEGLHQWGFRSAG